MSSNQLSSNESEPIAIVAIGSIFPGRGDTTGFWRDIVEGVDTFTSVPSTHWLTDDYYDSDRSAPDRTYGSRGAFIPPTAFDPLSFGVPPNSLSTTDTAQLLALVAARNVLDDIERETNSVLDKSRASVILGVAATTELVGQMMGRLQRPTWVKGMREAGLDEAQVQDIADRISSNFVEWRETTFPGLLGNVVAGRIANRLDFGGSNYVTDAACASSLSAMQIALHELHSGDSDLVLTGGVDALNDIFMYMCFSKTPALSPSGDCRPLSADADGTMLGEGVGLLALRRLSDAERDGNRIHAIVKGLGGGSDGRSTAVYAPLASGQERTLTRAYRKAGYSPGTVELVEAHGTGTVAGDRTELEALHSVFDPDGQASKPWCALGSVKSQIGHTKAAAGAAGLLKVIGGLSRKILPPTIKVRQPAEALCHDTPFYLGTKARPWIRGSSHPRRASVSSFGFGGSNFHVTLEEYTGNNAVQPVRVMPSELLLLSSSSAANLRKQIDALTDAVTHEDDLARVASESWARFDPKHAHRAAIVAESPQHLKTLCAKLMKLTGQGTDLAMPADRHIFYSAGAVKPGKLALLFAGQGSQYLGMGADIAMAFPQARSVWDSACDVPATAELKLHDIAFPPTLFSAESLEAARAQLTDMRHAQPAIATVALSQLALINQLGIRVDMQAGHSFGEVMALHSAGVFDAPAALTIACERADAMSSAAASSTGSMLAVQASVAAVNEVIEGVIEDITLANDNAPGQVVLSGDASRIEQAASLLASRSINSQILPVAAAFHSPQVEPAIQPFSEKLLQHAMAQASTPVYANSTAAIYPSDKAALVKMLSEQIGKPVLFRQTLESMYAAGATTFLEVGPGSVLTNLVRNSLPADKVTAIALDDKHSNGTTALLCAIGQLAVSGIDVNVASLFEGLPAPVARAKPGKHSVKLLGSNFQKPYPPQDSEAYVPNSVDRDATVTSAPLSDAARVSKTSNSTEAALAAESTFKNGTAVKAGSTELNGAAQASSAELNGAAQTSSAELNGAAQARHPYSTAQTFQKPPALHVTVHQSSTVAKSTMAMQDQPSGINGAAQRLQTQPVSNTAQPDNVIDGSPVRQTQVANTLQRDLFNNISAVHSEYMAALTDAHQSYLRLAAGLIDGAEGTTLSMPANKAASTSHKQSLPYSDAHSDSHSDLHGDTHSDAAATSSASLAPTSLNGHSHLNGATPAVHTTSHSTASPAGSHSTAADAEPVASTATPDSTVIKTTGGSPDISTDLVRSLIAEKTGYPAEMIEDDMDLSGELGIDSIKQVEVLSALRIKVPEIKDVGTADMGQLRTIRQIADFFG